MYCTETQQKWSILISTKPVEWMRHIHSRIYDMVIVYDQQI